MNNNENKNPQDFDLKRFLDYSNISKIVNNFAKSFYRYTDELEKIKHIPENINEINTVDLDLSTYEGYTEYMKRLGEVRNKVKDYDEFVKCLAGKTATEILDDIAKKATSYYLENCKTKKESIQKEQEQKCTRDEKEPNVKQCNCNVDNQKKYTINKADDVYVFPSERVDDETYSHICNIVDRYVDEEISKYCEINGLEPDDSFDDVYNELVEFACWVSKMK